MIIYWVFVIFFNRSLKENDENEITEEKSENVDGCYFPVKIEKCYLK